MRLPAPLLLILGPLLPALLTAIIRRWPRVAAAVGSASALLLWRFIAVVPLAPHQPPTLGLFAGDTLTLLGRSLVLTEGVRLAFALLFAGLAVLLLLAVWLPQGSDFIPASLTVLALLSAAIMARPFSFGVLLLLAAAAVSTAVIQANLPSSSDAALRYLVFVALATPLFLVAGWMLDSGQLSLQSAVWRLLLVGFAMLLAGFPFYVWVRPIVLTASSLTPAFQFGLMQFAQFMMVLALLRENNWVADVPSFLSLLRWSGLLTLVLGGGIGVDEPECRQRPRFPAPARHGGGADAFDDGVRRRRGGTDRAAHPFWRADQRRRGHHRAPSQPPARKPHLVVVAGAGGVPLWGLVTGGVPADTGFCAAMGAGDAIGAGGGWLALGGVSTAVGCRGCGGIGKMWPFSGGNAGRSPTINPFMARSCQLARHSRPRPAPPQWCGPCPLPAHHHAASRGIGDLAC